MSGLRRFNELKPPERILMGPGPSNVNYRVYKAMSTPILGHLDPDFMSVMDEICEMLRLVFKTKNRLTVPISGTGSSGMETAFVNLIEPEDKVIIGVNGLFGERMVDVALRCGARVFRIDEEWGKIIDPERVVDMLAKHPDTKIFAIVHAETSTGAKQPLEEIGAFLRDKDTLFVVDAVTSLGGCELKVDEWGIDVCYSGTQKCLSVPPGLSPITLSEKALYILHSKRNKVQSWYLDLTLIERYWGEERFYHHTAPVSMLFALHEGLRIVLEEGMERRIERHQTVGDYLKTRLQELGWELFAQEGYRLPMLTSVVLPNGVDDAKLRARLLRDYGIEIGGGLGKTKGRIWRIGLMGETCKRQNVELFLLALKELIR
ncbi:MAG: alanine--glyoxylate aminotransferase [Deltaproteobacteria bacterium]|jgi:alanine-glyoxylate transaminase/serine-glyoxylate transaminase/serine-pyruvate transaminase|nr:MAG: alanine--glyoxylate aminotransferase [Deltaproteobacteria bacterium]